MSEREITGAEIAESLGIPLGGTLYCKCERLESAPDLVGNLPSVGPGQPSTLSSYVFGGLALFFLLLAATQSVAPDYEGPAVGFALVLGFMAWLMRPRRARPCQAPPPYVRQLKAGPTELRLRWGNQWESYSWQALRKVQKVDDEYQLLIGPRDVRLRDIQRTRRLVHTAEMILDRRREAGRHGLRFVDEAGDAALSVTRLTGDEEAERGLSVTEDDGHE